MRSGSLLVARIRTPGQSARRRPDRRAAASTTCSQLSRISTASRLGQRAAQPVHRAGRADVGAVPREHALAQAERVEHRVGHLGRLADRGELGEPRRRGQPRRRLGRQPGLAHPARAGERDKPLGGQLLQHAGDVVVPADEAGRRALASGEARGRGLGRRHRPFWITGDRSGGGGGLERDLLPQDREVHLCQARGRVHPEPVREQVPARRCRRPARPPGGRRRPGRASAGRAGARPAGRRRSARAARRSGRSPRRARGRPRSGRAARWTAAPRAGRRAPRRTPPPPRRRGPGRARRRAPRAAGARPPARRPPAARGRRRGRPARRPRRPPPRAAPPAGSPPGRTPARCCRFPPGGARRAAGRSGTAGRWPRPRDGRPATGARSAGAAAPRGPRPGRAGSAARAPGGRRPGPRRRRRRVPEACRARRSARLFCHVCRHAPSRCFPSPVPVSPNAIDLVSPRAGPSSIA